MSKRTIEVELSTSGLDAQGRAQPVPLVTNDGGTAVAIDTPRSPKITRLRLDEFNAPAPDSPAGPLRRLQVQEMATNLRALLKFRRSEARPACGRRRAQPASRI